MKKLILSHSVHIHRKKQFISTIKFLLLITGYTFANGDKGKCIGNETMKNCERLHDHFSCFTPNKGQLADMTGQSRPDILYKGDCAEMDVYIRKGGISYVYSNLNELKHRVEEHVEDMVNAGSISEADENKIKQDLLLKTTYKVQRIDMDFEGSNSMEGFKNSNPIFLNEDELDGYQNFYYPHCPNGVINVKQYGKVSCKNIYNNIDIVYYSPAFLNPERGKQKGIKYDLIVQPHSDPNQIKLHWKGADSIHINSKGNLIINTSLNEFTESIPKVYQNIRGEVVDVKTEYILNRISAGEAIITFSFSAYNPSFPLVIDPWATYYGNNGSDQSTDLATDNTGNVVITGMTNSVGFPVQALAGGYSQPFGGGGNEDAFVVKFNNSGARIWATYYGGNNLEYGKSIATDNTGNIVITGFTWSTNFPTGKVGANLVFQSAYGGGSIPDGDAFIVKFDSNGVRQWATFYGGSDDDTGTGIAIDNSGNVVITGSTESANFPVLAAGGYSQAYGGKGNVFIVKFSPSGSLLWASYYGGNDGDYGQCIATDIANNIIITGGTASANFPVLPAGGYSQPYGGNGNAFVVKFNPNGTRLWATYYGGNNNDTGFGIAADNAGNVIVSGETGSANFPVLILPGGYTQAFGGNAQADAFIVKFNSAGVRQWATIYGGTNSDGAYGIAIDVKNNIYLLMEEEDPYYVGVTNAADLFADACAYQPVFNGGVTTNSNGGYGIEDQYIVKFTPDGKKVCATFLGGTGEDDIEGGGGIAVYNNSLFIAGATDGGFPVSAGAWQTTYGGGSFDAYVASICANICEGKVLSLNFTASNVSPCSNTPIKFTPTIANSCDTSGYTYRWVFTGGNPASSDSLSPTVSFSGIGSHPVKLIVTTICKKDSVSQLNYITTTQCAVCNLVGQYAKGTANCPASGGCGCKEWILVNATGGTSPYTYAWPDGYMNRFKNQLCPGSYTINIKDKNGCSVNVNLTAP